ncbi:MAG: hypothetical protein Q8O67_00675 [Deltaproteobacteria bacterium]|nr:hypothetical protein [Deltaproteobacteria bacterium]
MCDCIDDRGCDASESCNALGRCQAQRGCNSNEECGTDLFCDVIRGQCIAIDGCGTGHDCCVLDSQCGFGNVCDSLRQACVSGCRDEADCILGQSCAKSLGQPLGSCSAEVCGGDNLCDFGEVCSSDGACEIDNRGPYCLGCTGGVQSDDCGERGNFCLTDTINGGSFCAVDCAAGESCPFGYECRSVIIIPPAAPFCDAESCVIDGDGDGLCSLSGTRCSVDADCPIGFPGGDCLRADIGNCEIDQLRSCSDDSECADGDACLAQECRYREGAAIGHCTCTRDTDCPRDRCVDIRPDTTRGECELSGHDCFTDADCEAIITCVNGGCFIGRNCAPADGRTCRDFLDDPPLTPP